MKMYSSLKILLFIPILYVPASSAVDCGIVGNCEDVLLDLSLASSLDGCVINGRQVPGAMFVSWNSIANICEAYATCEDLDDSETNILTSSVECDVCNAPGLCLGHVVDDSVVEGEEECEQLCINEQTCEWFSYLGDQQFCLLLDDCTALDTSCSNCHTSMKTCLDSTSTVQPSTTEKASTTTSGSLSRKKLFFIDGGSRGKNNNSFFFSS